MQTQTIILILSLLLTACSKRESADDAIARSRGQGIDQLNTAGEGLPFFTAQQLNPTWAEETDLVRFPASQWVDQRGKSVDEKILQGKNTVLAFLFTSCSGFCPFVLQGVKKLAAALGERPDLQFVMVSVDPDHDTPERLSDYARLHGVDKDNWHFLRGSVETVDALAKTSLSSQIIRKADVRGRDIVHAGHFYLFDRKARLRSVLNGTELDVAGRGKKALEAL